ncbi:MAG: hypothetical protein KAI47_09375, partial [Deltaproteobacteria bacterium]|nr:hypothetical protein [Deltaproteobacteria bacterium]
MDRRPFSHFSLWLLVLALLSTTPSCTKTTSWAGEGAENAPCFPDGTCDPGLTCVAGVCQNTAQPPQDGRVTPD